MKRYFLGMAAEYADWGWFKHLLTIGRRKDCINLKKHLIERYGGEAILCKNGRSALTQALKAYFEPGDAIIVNGFTCYAVYEAVKAAGLTPVFADIAKEDLNFTVETILTSMGSCDSRPSSLAPVVTGLASSIAPVVANGRESHETHAHKYSKTVKGSSIRGIIVQNTLGNPVNIEAIEKFAQEHELMIIEDLAHSAGVKYPDGREAGTVGVATALSFGKDKSIDTISGGAVIFHAPRKNKITPPSRPPRPSDHLRARFYPMWGALCRSLTPLKLGGPLMRLLVKIHWVERSADSTLDLARRISKFEAKLALKRFEQLSRNGEPPLRNFYLVHDRDELLKKLQKKGYYFAGFWYEKPISPERYYKKVHFPEAECPVATYVAKHIINVPNYYTRRDLKPALKIIKQYQEDNK